MNEETKVRLNVLRSKHPGRFQQLAPRPFGAPNIIERDGSRTAWYTPDHHIPFAALDASTHKPWAVIYHGLSRYGDSPRAAYRAACRANRLYGHNVPDLLRNLAQAKRGLSDERRTNWQFLWDIRSAIAALHARRERILRRTSAYRVRIAELEAKITQQPAPVPAPTDGATPGALDSVTLAHLRGGWPALDDATKDRIARALVDQLCQPYAHRGTEWQMVTHHLRHPASAKTGI